MRTDDSLVVATTRLGVQRDYHFRCVPLDFPRLTVSRPGNPTPGWYLTTFGFSSGSQPNEFVRDPRPLRRPGLVQADLAGGHRRQATVGRSGGVHSDLWTVRRARGAGLLGDRLPGFLDSTLPDDRHTALPTDHHDFLEIPGGHALLSYPLVTGEDLRPFGSNPDVFADGVIQEVNTVGAQTWRWDTSKHFAPNASTFPINFADSNGLGPQFDAWDVFHLNSIDRMPDGDYVVSARHLDAVFR